MTPLELRYRRLLRLLPSPYLAMRREEMVDTFLLSTRREEPEAHALEEVVGHPSWAERLSIVRLAVALRCGGRHAPPRYEVLGGAVRWCIAAVVVIQAMSAIQWLVGYTWMWHAGFWVDGSHRGQSWAQNLTHDLAYVWWIPTFIALSMRRARITQVCAGLATMSALIGAVIATRSLVWGGWPLDSVVSAWLLLMVDLGVVLGLGSFHREAPRFRARPWVICGAVGVGLFNVVVFIPATALWVRTDDLIFWCLGVVLGAATVLLMGRAWTVVRRARAHLGLALLCAVALLLYAPHAVDLVISGAVSDLPAPYLISILVQVMLTTVIGVAFAIAGLRHVRLLPRVSYSPIAPGVTNDSVCARRRP